MQRSCGSFSTPLRKRLQGAERKAPVAQFKWFNEPAALFKRFKATESRFKGFGAR